MQRRCYANGSLLLAPLLLILLLPTSADAFFCNQNEVSITWGKHSPFKIDGNGFARGNFRVLNAGNEDLIRFEETEILNGLEAEFSIEGLKPGTTSIEVAWEFTDQSDNGVCVATVEVSDLSYGIENAFVDLGQYAASLDLDSSSALGLMLNRPLCPGDEITSAYDSVPRLTVSTDSYFGYLDFSKEARYGHLGQYVTIDGATGEMNVVDAESPPMIGGTTYSYDDVGRFRIGSDVRLFYGGYNDPTPESDPNLIADEMVSSVPKTEVCAVLVSGTATNQRQLDAFAQDVDFIKGNLMRERLGPQLTESDIAVLNNASFEEIREKLESFRGRYSKVYFFYSGHGTERYMVTNDTVGNRMWYVDLASALEKTEAEDICVVIDACHSGGAIPTFQQKTGLQSRNVTLLTSCRADTSSWTRYIVTGGGDTVRTGEYTWAFAKCFGDPQADQDGDGKTSLVEAHQWALVQNPTLDLGGTLRGRMDPQIWVHRAPPTTERVIRPADTRLSIDQGETERFPNGSELRIDMLLDRDDTVATDPDVFSISPDIQWKIGIEPQLSTGYRISMQFDYSSMRDRFSGDGEPGVVWRPESNAAWQVYRPSRPLPTDDSVLVLDLTELGEFALAEVTPSDGSVGRGSSADGLHLYSNRPDPFTESTSIGFDVGFPAEITLVIVDEQGRVVRTLDEGWRSTGSHSTTWNGRSDDGTLLPSGLYIVELRSTTSQGRQIRVARSITLIR